MSKIKIFFKNTTIILILILGLALGLRLLFLGSLPSSLNVDEVLIGYEAYSISKTGYDHRKTAFLPRYITGYSDQVDNRTGILYTYLLIPVIRLFGLNEFSVRFPAAILGSLTVYLTFLLARQLLKKELALVACFLLAFSPWHILLSRYGNEPVLLSFLISLALYLFLRGLKSRRYLIASALVFALTFYSYSLALSFIPLLLGALVVIFRKELKQKKKKALLALIVFLILISPSLYTIKTGQTWGELPTIWIFQMDKLWPIYLLTNYLDYFSYFFLKQNIFYLFEIVLLAFGILALFRSSKLEYRLLRSWLFLFPVPASFTLLFSLSSSVTRGCSGLVVIQMVEALGLGYLYSLFREKIKFLKIVSLVILAFIGLNFYLLITSKLNPPICCYNPGFKEIVEYINKNQDKYPEIIISDTKMSKQYYMYLLFYLFYPPEKIQSENVKREYLPGGIERVLAFDKYRFCYPIESCYSANDNNLYIVHENELEDQPAKKTIKVKQKTIFKIISNRE